jgi:hypothetical protein
MKYFLIILFEFSIYSGLLAGNDNYPAGARSSGLATASVCLTDVWSGFNNQAGLAWLNAPTLGFHYENKFLVKEYALQAGTFGLPLKPGTLGLNYRYFGYSKYHETKVGLAFARKLYKRLAVGVQLNYHQTYLADGYGAYSAVTTEIGMIYNPLDNLYVGIHAFNPNRVKSNATPDEYIPTIYRMGVRYSILEKATLLFETEKNLEHKQVYKGGLELNALKGLDFRVGFGSDYVDYSFGLGYHSQRFAFDLAFSHHYILGFTPHISFSLNLSRMKLA